jgi:5-methylcytosine-specific restriction endonuclease McrA
VFPKPCRGDFRAELQRRKKERQREKAKATRRLKLAHRATMLALRAACYHRDHGRCRCCGAGLVLESENLRVRMQTHHIIYRSAGGADELGNCISLCFDCHRQEHGHELDITGDANGTLIIVERNLETGRIVRQWESAV